MYLPPLIAQLKAKLRSTAFTSSIAPAPKVRRLGVGAPRSNTGAKFIKLGGSLTPKNPPHIDIIKTPNIGFRYIIWARLKQEGLT
jgi:hypothetical protein|tara:strand:- start:653 stop:907 length:255 start_codon:yes stop_codon:yes gene_type:complete